MKLEAAAKPEDGPVLVQAEIKHVGAILHDNEGRRVGGRARQCLRIREVNFEKPSKFDCKMRNFPV